MQELKERKKTNKENYRFKILGFLKNGKTKLGIIVYPSKEEAERHWDMLLKFVPMQMKKYSGYEVIKL